MKRYGLVFLVFMATFFLGFPLTSGPNLDIDQSWFRFEEGGEACFDVECEVTESFTGDPVGRTDAEYSTDVPFTNDPAGGEFVNGEKNTFSLRFQEGTHVRFDPLLEPDVPTFIFHDPEAAGSIEATLEWYMKVQQVATKSHNAVFWTELDRGDGDRFNIWFDSAGLGGDYREPGPPDGNPEIAHSIGRSIVLPFDVWTHIACVRKALDDGRHLYTWYVNHQLKSRAPDDSPNLPLSQGWTIAGRPGRKFQGWIDEVRMTPRALETSELLPKAVERPPDEICDNGVDEDGDDDIDCADSDCVGNATCVEVCDDGEDNDADGNADCTDADCEGDPACPSGIGPFLRGDCDGNTVVGGSPTEAIVLLNFAFRGGAAPGCLAACDAEANGSIGITDALRILRHSFLGLGEPDPPFPDCTTSDLESDLALGCETPPGCP